jgi:tRNA-specific 2-thiouridylase
MSGGVDSSVSAALLQEQGYRVEGAFVVTWTVPWLPCTWREEREDAMRVAQHLGIPFHTIDLSLEYERDVVSYLINEYRAGRTPNPDVMCNKVIKFGGLYAWAMEHGFDYLATGHYARSMRDDADGTYRLYAGLDRNKDQSYFLWTLTGEQLSHVLFPVGALEKRDVRELARSYGLSTAEKKDSQGICFLGDVNMKEFLTHYIDVVPGDVLDTDGAVIGSHDGAILYTLGERHGFRVFVHTPDMPPLYVVAKDVERNTITVAPEHAISEALPEEQIIRLAETNWIRPLPPAEGQYLARLRYRQPLFPVVVTANDDGTAAVSPETPQRYVPSGQSVVVYDGDECLGGGIITEE